MEPEKADSGETDGGDGRSDLKVVLQFFIVPLALVAVLVAIFVGLQFARGRPADPGATLKSLQNYEGFLAGVVGDLKRWQYGYDLSLLMRGKDAGTLRDLLPELDRAFHEAGEKRDLKLRRYLALALGASQDARAAGPLRDGLRDPDGETRLFCAWGLMRSGDPSAASDLRGAARDPDSGVRKMAVFALGEMRDRDSVAVLRQALADETDDVRWNAALALARLGDGAAAPVLIALLQASTAPPADVPTAAEGQGRRPAIKRDQAMNAIRGLALLKSPEASELLGRLSASSDDPEIREAAGLAIAAYRSAVAGKAP